MCQASSPSARYHDNVSLAPVASIVNADTELLSVTLGVSSSSAAPMYNVLESSGDRSEKV
jgi:hypothetical protein